MYIMMIEKEISVIVNLIESYGHDTRPLFLSLSSIAPSEAVSLFRLCLLQCSEKAQVCKVIRC